MQEQTAWPAKRCETHAEMGRCRRKAGLMLKRGCAAACIASGKFRWRNRYAFLKQIAKGAGEKWECAVHASSGLSGGCTSSHNKYRLKRMLKECPVTCFLGNEKALAIGRPLLYWKYKKAYDRASTDAPTASPTAAPTVSPTAAPTASPTAAPTPLPTPSPTASPTPEPYPRKSAYARITWGHDGNVIGYDDNLTVSVMAPASTDPTQQWRAIKPKGTVSFILQSKASLSSAAHPLCLAGGDKEDGNNQGCGVVLRPCPDLPEEISNWNWYHDREACQNVPDYMLPCDAGGRDGNKEFWWTYSPRNQGKEKMLNMKNEKCLDWDESEDAGDFPPKLHLWKCVGIHSTNMYGQKWSSVPGW